MDVGRRPAPSVLQGTARGGAAVGVPRRRHAGARRRRGAGRRAHAEGHEPRQGPLSEGGVHQARRHRLLRRDRAGDPAAPRGADRSRACGFPTGSRARASSRRSARRTGPTGSTVAPVPLSGKIVEFCVCDDLPTLVWLANLAALELHTQLHRERGAQPPDDDGLRPRSGAAGDDRRVLPRRPVAAGDVREPRPAVVRQDVGFQGAAGLRAAQHARRDVRADQGLRVRGRRAARGIRARSSSSRA